VMVTEKSTATVIMMSMEMVIVMAMEREIERGVDSEH
jgi:hypothetical protein